MKKKKQINNVALYAVIGFVVFIGTLSVYFWYQNFYGNNYQKAVSSELSDICATPPGYTDESWRQHISHHPDRYAQCLK